MLFLLSPETFVLKQFHICKSDTCLRSHTNAYTGRPYHTLRRCGNQFRMSPVVAAYLPQHTMIWLSREPKRQRTNYAVWQCQNQQAGTHCLNRSVTQPWHSDNSNADWKHHCSVWPTGVIRQHTRLLEGRNIYILYVRKRTDLSHFSHLLIYSCTECPTVRLPPVLHRKSGAQAAGTLYYGWASAPCETAMQQIPAVHACSISDPASCLTLTKGTEH